MGDENKKSDGTKVSLYMSAVAVSEIREISAKLDRSFSWTLAKAWELSKDAISKLPAA